MNTDQFKCTLRILQNLDKHSRWYSLNIWLTTLNMETECRLFGFSGHKG
uniref:Uncharacterized protein n=1 Tax=mine drainage metagenome TaxID=410659 RepID=E6QX54_9ZZZZ